MTGLVASDFKVGKTIALISGGLPNCAADGASTCFVNGTTYKAAKLSNFAAADVRSGVAVAGVSGSATMESHSNCSVDGASGCVATAAYPAADVARITAANLKAGVTLAGVTGDYPSATYRLAGAGGTPDLSGGTFNSQINNAATFEYWDSAGARHTGTGDANITAANIVSGVSIFGASGSAVVESHSACASDGASACVPDGIAYKAARLANFAAGDVRSGITIAGVPGTATMESHGNCVTDGGQGCVTTGGYPAANASLIVAGNIKSGVTIAGVSGQYPSATYPLSGADATADLTAGTFSTQVKSGTSFEYWNSAGVRQTGAGSANIVAANIVNGVSIFGAAGSATVESHAACASDGASGCAVDGTLYKAARLANFGAADIKSGITIASVAGSSSLETHSNCAADGATGCVAIPTYPAANASAAVPGNIKFGVTIAGATGQFPSSTYPLAGADATADLNSASFATQMKNATV